MHNVYSTFQRLILLFNLRDYFCSKCAPAIIWLAAIRKVENIEIDLDMRTNVLVYQ